MNVTFYGVRGSTPCACESTRRYGGNTSCVVLTRPAADPIVFDLGTGLRYYGMDIGCGQPFRGTALVSHLHWDHVQGIPFFAPWLSDGSRLDVYGPAQGATTLEEAVRSFIKPPYFPVTLDDLPGEVTITEATPEFSVGDAQVRTALVPHIGPTLGYRVTLDGVTVVFIPDHQQPGAGSTVVDPAVLELCEGADLLIHDAQFDNDEFTTKADWGHCTVEYAVEVAAQAGVRRLALFHHDPSHGDERLDALLADAQAYALGRGVEEVIAAAEGLTVALSPAADPASPNAASPVPAAG
ncbi:MAG: MBL fold metallo-hydrolase [Actinomycetes bacterium]